MEQQPDTATFLLRGGIIPVAVAQQVKVYQPACGLTWRYKNVIVENDAGILVIYDQATKQPVARFDLTKDSNQPGPWMAYEIVK